MTLRLALVLGTARTGRQSEKAAHFLKEHLENRDEVSLSYFDVRDARYDETVPPWGEGGAEEKETAWKKVAEEADAFLLVVPEYNHGYPGELKLLLDSLYDEYQNKAVGVCAVSGGGLGGARVAEHIQPVLTELGLKLAKKPLYVSKVKEAFDEDGKPIDPKLAEKADALVEELTHLAHSLKALRV